MNLTFKKHSRINVFYTALLLLIYKLSFLLFGFVDGASPLLGLEHLFFFSNFSFQIPHSLHFILSYAVILTQGVYLNNILNQHRVFPFSNDYFLLFYVLVAALNTHSNYLSVPLLMIYFHIYLLDSFLTYFNTQKSYKSNFLSIGFAASLLTYIYFPNIFLLFFCFIFFLIFIRGIGAYFKFFITGCIAVTVMLAEIFMLWEYTENYGVYVLSFLENMNVFHIKLELFMFCGIFALVCYVYYFFKNYYASNMKSKILFTYLMYYSLLFAAFTVILFEANHVPFVQLLFIPFGFMLTYIFVYIKQRRMKISFFLILSILTFFSY